MAELTPGGLTVGRIFRAFHTLVVNTVERLESGPWAPEAPPEIEPLRAPILAAIGLVEQQLAEEPAAEPAVAREILYLLAVYADDQAMAASGPGGLAWSERRIESELFGSTLGAAEVEARCERLLHVPTPENRQLARLFLYAFGLGLGSGAFAAAERLAGLRRRLLDFARPARQPAAAGRRRLFRQAYRYTAARGERRLLPDLRGWLALAAVVLVVFALFSFFVWERAVASVADALAPAGRGAPVPATAGDGADNAPPRQAPSAAEPPAEPAEPASVTGTVGPTEQAPQANPVPPAKLAEADL